MNLQDAKRIIRSLPNAACLLLIASMSCTQHAQHPTERTEENTWVFLLAGQSNMAGRGKIEPQDTVTHPRIWTINAEGTVIQAKEPLHFYEPRNAGLDCGMAFASTLMEAIPDSIHILLIPTAVGGSAIDQWLGDSLHRDVRLLTNFREKAELGKHAGVIKGILWHQGESDATAARIPPYPEKMATLFQTFRIIAGNDALPILTAETGSYGKNKANRDLINAALHAYAATDVNTCVVASAELAHKGDETHFSAESLRTLGQRYATQFLHCCQRHEEKASR